MTTQNTSLENQSILGKLQSINIVNQIIIAIVFGIVLALISPEIAKSFSMLGSLFVSALKAVAPILVLPWTSFLRLLSFDFLPSVRPSTGRHVGRVKTSPAKNIGLARSLAR